MIIVSKNKAYVQNIYKLKERENTIFSWIEFFYTFYMNDKSLSKNFFYIIENYYYIIITHQFPTIKMVNPIFHLYKKKSLRWMNTCMLICQLWFTPGLFYRVWDVRTGEMTNTLIHHCEAVLHLRFCDGIMVTCSKVGHLKWRILVLTAWKSKTYLCCIVTSFELKVC